VKDCEIRGVGLLSCESLTGVNEARGKFATFNRRDATGVASVLDNEKAFALLVRRAVC
jgi:hypothetical protein